MLALFPVFEYAVAREPVGERTNKGVGQGIRLAVGLRGVVISYRWV